MQPIKKNESKMEKKNDRNIKKWEGRKIQTYIYIYKLKFEHCKEWIAETKSYSKMASYTLVTRETMTLSFLVSASPSLSKVSADKDDRPARYRCALRHCFLSFELRVVFSIFWPENIRK